MSGQVRQFVAERWSFGILQPKLKDEDLVRELNLRMGKLEQTLVRLHDSIENGPLPGAYLTIPLYCDTPDIEDEIARSYPPRSYQGLRIIGCSASISGQSDSGAELAIEVEYFDAITSTWGSILTNTPQTVNSGTPVQLNSAGDFVAPYFAAGGFRVNCTDMTNIPKGLMVLLYAKNVGKIEPVP